MTDQAQLQRIATQIVAQLPENREDAEAVLRWAQFIVQALDGALARDDSPKPALRVVTLLPQ